MTETPDLQHGRLLESMHIAGYSFERACRELKWLLEYDRWKECGDGYDNIDDFLLTVDLSRFKQSLNERKELTQLLAKAKATQRAIAGAIGVNEITVARDLGKRRGSTNVDSEDSEKHQKRSDEPTHPTNVAPDPLISLSADDVVKGAEKKKVHVENNSGENEWYTPVEIIEAARAVMGQIDTDPASSKKANETVRAKQFFSQADDGRTRTWDGKVWMNPPYAQPLVSEFCTAVSEKFDTGEISEACVLVNNATETSFFQRMLQSASAVCFPKGRLRFIDMNGNPSGAPLQGQAILYFGPEADAFADAFCQFGAVLHV